MENNWFIQYTNPVSLRFNKTKDLSSSFGNIRIPYSDFYWAK